MKQTLKALMAAAALVAAGHAAAQITLYEHDGFRGRSVTTNERVWNLDRIGFNDRASSIVVESGRWEVCENARFEGRCFILRRGSYPSLHELGLNDQISSLRPVQGRSRWHEIPPPVAYVQPAAPVVVQPAPQVAVQPAYDWRARPGEQVFEVPVSSVRAVVGAPNQRCWIERQQVTQSAPSSGNVGGALIGGIVGGILGHQVGGGTGKDVATAAGAIGGAVVGSNLANQNNGTAVTGTRDVQRCENVTSATPEYYDVTYFFNGSEHHMQTTQPPGRTVRVNGYGEPRM